MDDVHFDTLARSLTSSLRGSTTRRGITRFLGGLSLDGTITLLGLGEAGAKCKKKCGPCKRCKKGKCKPKLAGTACAGGTCQGGTCIPSVGPAPPPPPPPPPRPFCAGKNDCVADTQCQVSGAVCFCYVRADGGHVGEPFCGQAIIATGDNCSVCATGTVCIDATGPSCGKPVGCAKPCANPQ